MAAAVALRLDKSKSSFRFTGLDADLSDQSSGGQSKSSKISLVSSTPMRLPTAQTNLLRCMLIRQTTPPRPPLSRASKLRMNSPVSKFHSLTVPSSDDETTNFSLNARHVTALICLLQPLRVCKHSPVLSDHILTVESAFPDTKMSFLICMPLVSEWCPVSLWMIDPVCTFHTMMVVSSEPDTMRSPSNSNEYTRFTCPSSVWRHSPLSGFQTRIVKS